MKFLNVCGGIARFFKDIGNGRSFKRQAARINGINVFEVRRARTGRRSTQYMQDTRLQRRLPRHIGRARRRTDRRRRIGLHEAHAVLRYTIYMRRFIDRLLAMHRTVVTRHILPPQVIRQDMNDIGFGCCLCSRRSDCQSQNKKTGFERIDH